MGMNNLTSLFTDSADLMSAFAGAATALAVALALTVYFRIAYRTWRDMLRHGLAALGAVILAAAVVVAFVGYDMRHGAQAFLGLAPSEPAAEFEILTHQNVYTINYRVP
jgi:hypothetical protein